MKKAICIALCALILITFCGCRSSVGEMLSDFGNAVNKIVEKTGVLSESGIFITRKIGKNEVAEITPADPENESAALNYYNCLNKEQKHVYRYLLAAAEQMPYGWFDCGKATADFANDISVAYKAMLCDNPGIFWMPPSYLIAKSSGRMCVGFKMEHEGENNDYLMTAEQRDTARALLEERVSHIVSVAIALPNDYEKELYVHDYLCEHAAYNEQGGQTVYSSYGALVEGFCVCEGYSRAMQLLMQRLGIECVLVYGEYQGDGHMWNCVNIGGSWYHLDITWDRSEHVGTLHGFFNLTDEQITADHTLSPAFTAGVDYSAGQNYNLLLFECNSTAYNYFEYGGRYLTDDMSANAEKIYADYLRGAVFSELIDRSSYSPDQTLSRTATHLYGRLTLTTYSNYKNELVVFFENTY